MVTRVPKDMRLVVLPADLVRRLRAKAIRRGASLSGFAAEALEEAVKVEEMGASVNEAVEEYYVQDVLRASGAIQVPRSNFNAMISELHDGHREEFLGDWERAGRWYGEYVHARLGEGALGFLEKTFLLSWNLDEVSVENDGLLVRLRLTSFVMSLELTELLVSYITGAMASLGFAPVEKDYVRGLATLVYRRVPGG